MANLTIKLGPHWQRFIPCASGLVLLGSVQQEAAIGALACSPEGTYWQINGDHRRKLNTVQVEAALQVAQRWQSENASGNTATAPVAAVAGPPGGRAPAPTVIVKRKRVLEMPEGRAPASAPVRTP